MASGKLFLRNFYGYLSRFCCKKFIVLKLKIRNNFLKKNNNMMETTKSLKELGEISKELIILGGIIIAVVVVVVIVISTVMKPPPSPPEPIKKGPVYEITLGDIKFKLKEAKDKGNLLEASEGKYPDRYKDTTTTERFIRVIISAENIGKESTGVNFWGLKEISDSDGRKFDSSEELKNWATGSSKCGAKLKPGFTPVLCEGVYEVAKISTGLKIKVFNRESSKEGFIDLGL